MEDDAIERAGQMAQDQVNQAIDELAQKVPGGDKAAEQAKQKADEAVEGLEEEVKKRFGGLFGKGG